MYQIHIGFHIRIRSISYAFFVYYIRLFCVRVFLSNVLLFGEFPNRLFREILVSKMDISACSKRGKNWNENEMCSLSMLFHKQNNKWHGFLGSSRRMKFCQFNGAPSNEWIELSH